MFSRTTGSGERHEKVGREPRPVGTGAHLEKNRRTRGLARGNPQQNAQAHQGSRSGRRPGVRVDVHSDLVARRHHLHWRILQECREAYLLQGRVSEGSGPSLQLESRRKRTPRDRHPRGRRSWRIRLQGARSPSGRPQPFWQVETFEESEVLKDFVLIPNKGFAVDFGRLYIKDALGSVSLCPQRLGNVSVGGI